MEKICEFCKALRPVVYCEADAAHLCLSCDAKVHSANALSYRHPRTLICESCRYQPVYVKCLEHQMFICQNCDASFHISFQHHRKEVSSYVGSPSAKDLAALWGFDFNELENQSYANTPSNSTTHKISDEGSSSRGRKVTKEDRRELNTSLIVQQILAFGKLQLPTTLENLRSVHVNNHKNGSYLKKDIVWQMDMNSPNNESIEELFSEPYLQVHNLTSAGNSHHGDLLWQCKSSVYNNEIWLHNIQDIGVCDEVQCFDDVNTPDIDLTFQNFEDLFGSDQEPSGVTVDDDDENMAQLGTFDRCLARMSEKFNIEEKPSDPRAIMNSCSRITGEHKFDYNKNVSCNVESSHSQETKNVMKRYKEKKDRHVKQSRYASPKSKFNGHK